MFADFAPYLFLLMLGGVAAILLTFKSIAEKFVAAGILPRAFLGLVPALQVAMRVFGVILVIAGVVRIGEQAGWVNPETLSRYGFSVAILVLGLILLFLSPRKGA